MKYSELKKELLRGVPYTTFWDEFFLHQKAEPTLDQLKSQVLLNIYSGNISRVKLLCSGFIKDFTSSPIEGDLELIVFSIRYQVILPDSFFAEKTIGLFTDIEICQIIYETIMSWGFNKSLIDFLIALVENKKSISALQLLFKQNATLDLEKCSWFKFYRELLVNGKINIYTEQIWLKKCSLQINKNAESMLNLSISRKTSIDIREVSEGISHLIKHEAYLPCIAYLEWLIDNHSTNSTQVIDLNILLNLVRYLDSNHKQCIFVDLKTIFTDLTALFSKFECFPESLINIFFEEIFVHKGYDYLSKFCVSSDLKDLLAKSNLLICSQISQDLINSLRFSNLAISYHALIRNLSLDVLKRRDYRLIHYFSTQIKASLSHTSRIDNFNQLRIDKFIAIFSPFYTLCSNKSRSSILIFNIFKTVTSHLKLYCKDSLYMALFLSCQGKIEMALNNTIDFDNKLLGSLVISGNEENGSYFFGVNNSKKWITVECPDDYLNLPTKVSFGFIMSLLSDNILSVIKLDDDATLHSHESLEIQLKRAAFHGFNIIGIETKGSKYNYSEKHHGASLWAYGRLPANDSYNLNPITQDWPKNSYPNGGTTYIASRSHLFNCFKQMLSNYRLITEHTAEDMLTGIIMENFNESYLYPYNIYELDESNKLANPLGINTNRWNDKQSESGHPPLNINKYFFSKNKNLVSYYRVVKCISISMSMSINKVDYLLTVALLHVFKYGLNSIVCGKSLDTLYENENVAANLPPLLLIDGQIEEVNKIIQLFGNTRDTGVEDYYSVLLKQYLKDLHFCKL